MTEKTLTDFLRQLGIAKRAQKHYLARAEELYRIAGELAATNHPVLAAIKRHDAYIVYRAARAELLDPEPLG